MFVYLVWEQEARVGPMLVLPAMKKSGPLPEEELPPLLHKISRPALYGSQWRSGTNNRETGTSLTLNHKRLSIFTNFKPIFGSYDF